jgi:O-antigen ligase
MKNHLSSKVLTLTLFAIPISITIGIAAVEVLSFIIILFFLINIKNLDFKFDKKIIFLFFLAFYYAILAYLKIDTTLNIKDDLRYSSFFYFRYVLISLSILFLLDRINSSNKVIVFSVLIFCSLIMLDAWLQFFSGRNLLGYEIIKNRISGVFGDDLILGSFLARVLPFLVWLIFFFKIDIEKNYNFLLIFISSCFITVYLSSERTSLILLLFTIILFYFFIKDLRKLLLKSIIICIISVIVIYISNLGKYDPTNRIIIKTFNQITNYKFVEEDLDNVPTEVYEKVLNRKKSNLYNERLLIFSLDHTQHYILAYKLFTENPYFGVGPKGFRNYCRKVSYDPDVGFCSSHPHNIIAQLLSETGIVGISLFLIAYFFVITKLVMTKLKDTVNLKQSSYQFYIISIAIIINLFPLLPSGNYFNNWFCILTFYYVGLYLFTYKKILS